MNTSMIIDTLSRKQNGSFFKIRLVSDVKLNAEAKRNGVVAYKISDMTVRKGIDYKNQKCVKEKVEAGKVLTHELPFGEWAKGYEGLVIEHKGNKYIRLYSTPNKASVKYVLNGREVSFDDLKKSGLVLNSYFSDSRKEKPDCMTVKAENIQEIW